MVSVDDIYECVPYIRTLGVTLGMSHLTAFGPGSLIPRRSPPSAEVSMGER